MMVCFIIIFFFLITAFGFEKSRGVCPKRWHARLDNSPAHKTILWINLFCHLFLIYTVFVHNLSTTYIHLIRNG